MIVERIKLTEEENGAFIDAYIADPFREFTRKALLVIPGGGYKNISRHEGEPVAQAFIPYGYNTFVLRYTVGKDSGKAFPAQLIEATLAIKHIKDNAEKYGIDPAELYVVGFSAGGHLAASVATMWKHEAVLEAVEMPYGYNRPKGVMLVYPMISPEYSNCEGYTKAWGTLLGCEEPTREQLNEAAIERHVDADTAPAFIVHTFNDRIVDVRNAMILGKAYAEAGVPFEMHVYPDGPHGFSIANEIIARGRVSHIKPRIAEWVRLAAEWAQTL
ncbi:MAG: alpha/beta hydrolase [Clostridia bacterium]|nr:alpha/beta hydrolase [Clostridia bacterium]